jgi:hypothetical protein
VEDALDPATGELREFVVRLATKLAVDFGNEWHASRQANEAFAAGIALRIENYKPLPPEVGPDRYGFRNEPAVTIGRTRERDDRREHDYPQMRAALERQEYLFWSELNKGKDDE